LNGDVMTMAPIQDQPERTNAQTLARIRFDLRWQSEDATHTDTRVATRLDLRRDLFPPELEAEVRDRPVGHVATRRFEPGTLLPPMSDDLRQPLRTEQFDRGFARGGLIEPRQGRFYPRAILKGVEGVSRGDRRPFRLVEVEPGGITADLNHPLADRILDIGVWIQAIRARGDERGGRCTEVHELITADGPGMQGRWRGQPTDFWSDAPFVRLDPRPDREFYASPRLVDHLDRTAIAEISALYGRLIPAESRILDLMTSWHSHLDAAMEPLAVTGLGMNQAELEANPVLTDRLVQDLNGDPILPFGDESFAAVICTVSVEYLTRPFEVFREVARVLEPGGRFILTFSNRWFPPKVIRIWQDLHEFERLALVLDYLRESGRFGHLETWSLRGLSRPPDDKYADRLAESDPVYAVWGSRL
jgi:SAM-dependent methyltransferase